MSWELVQFISRKETNKDSNIKVIEDNLDEVEACLYKYESLSYIIDGNLREYMSPKEYLLVYKFLEPIRYWDSKYYENKIQDLATFRKNGIKTISDLDNKLAKITEKLFTACKKNQQELKYELGLLLAVVPLKEVPRSTRKKIKTTRTKTTETIIPALDKGWYLCGTSEERLRISMERGDTILLNDNLLVKFEGRIAALCLKTFTTKSGCTFLSGVWYTPSDTNTRTKLKDDFNNGLLKTNISGGEWAVTRALETSYKDGYGEKYEPKDILKDSIKYAKYSSKRKLSEKKAQERSERVRRENWNRTVN